MKNQKAEMKRKQQKTKQVWNKENKDEILLVRLETFLKKKINQLFYLSIIY